MQHQESHLSPVRYGAAPQGQNTTSTKAWAGPRPHLCPPPATSQVYSGGDETWTCDTAEELCRAMPRGRSLTRAPQGP